MIDTIQRQEIPEEGAELQMMSIVQREPGGGIAAAPDLEAAIQRARGSGQPLSRGIRAPMEQAFGADFGGVKVHTGSESDTLNRSIQARAFTTGQDVFFRQGAYDHGSRSGQELLAHELTHVVQQNERVSMHHDRLNVVDKFDGGGGVINRSVYMPGIPAITSVISRTQRSIIQPAYTARRPLSNLPQFTNFWIFHHRHIFFEDGGTPANIGFMGPVGLQPDTPANIGRYRTVQAGLDDAKMRTAVAANSPPGGYNLFTNNCQHWVRRVLNTYNTLP